MRISDWSSDVCSSDLTSIYASSSIQTPGFSTMLVEPNHARTEQLRSALNPLLSLLPETATKVQKVDGLGAHNWARGHDYAVIPETFDRQITSENAVGSIDRMKLMRRSEEHTSELQSLMRISYAVFCLKKKKKKNKILNT